ncbi:AfsR/SARP family transcriptional regulator [Streptomyces sp. enrichment culture]|uniref:AfsR/SARP family transcriptional regulator n=1 Tax=Streptomyces sp. enrichment culture TaxID=1795815 RepID=UPI003F54B4AA
MHLHFSVLGPVRAWCGDREVEVGPPKQRALLALLLVRAGEPVAMHDIVDVLWGQDPPASASNVVQRHVGNLRRLLEPGLPARAASRRLVLQAGAYRLEANAENLDLLRFRELCQEADRMSRRGDAVQATELLLQALALWRGPTASGIAPASRAHPVFTAVDNEHLAAVKEAARLSLEAGPGLVARVLVVLQHTAAQYPLDETLQAGLVLCLAAVGRQAQALQIYRSVRSRLAEELGVDPGAELQAAQQCVLEQTIAWEKRGPRRTTRAAEATADVEGTEDAGTRGSAADGGGSQSVPDTLVHPAQLPADLPVFTGRQAELEKLSALWAQSGERTTVVVIGGMAGVGKTTLAVHWAHRIAHHFTDGQLYVNLRGFHPSGSRMSTAEAIRSFLDALGVPAHRVPAGLEAQAALYRSLLAGRRVLIFLDNAHDTEHVLPLLPAAAGCLVIVTSRNRLYGLVVGEGAHAVTLDVMKEAEAQAFLRHRLGADRVAREPAAVAELISACGHLPLALAVVSARAAMNPAFTLASVAAELRESRGSLDAFTVEVPVADARSAFSWSYQLLSAEAARLFRLLGLHPGPDCALKAVASLAGQQPGQVRPVLTELVRAHLIFESAPGHYGCHELLRAYAAELLRACDATDDTGSAGRRLLDHYLHSAYAAEVLLAPSLDRLAPPPHRADVTVSCFADHAEAESWLDANRSALLATIEYSARHGHSDHSWRLAATVERYLDRSGRWQEQTVAQTTALAAAQLLGDVNGQAHAHRALGFAHGRLGHWDEAEKHLSHALKLFSEIGDRAGQARVHRYFAFLANLRQRYEEALDRYRQAGDLYAIAGCPAGAASVANEVGWTYILKGEHRRAVEECGRALAAHRAVGDRNGEAAAWDSLGYAHHHMGAHYEALICYGQALDLYRALHDRYLEADTLVHIGDTHKATGKEAQAASAWRQGLGILDEIGHPDAESVRKKLRQLHDLGTSSAHDTAPPA